VEISTFLKIQKRMKSERVCIIIPSRWSSSRFPGKPLADILGKSMIQRVYEGCKESEASEVIVATDDERILNHVKNFGNCILTPEFENGTLRVCWASKKLDFDFIINVQGDEPLISPGFLNSFIKRMLAIKRGTVLTAACPLDLYQMKNPNHVKLISRKGSEAVCFTRSPFFSDNNFVFKHIGIYGFFKEDLELIEKLKPSENSQRESLEQIRWMEEGIKIKYITTYSRLNPVDIPEDIKEIEKILRS
jgi:3-deoxy-manno-octulosonate cytidylyltransferase (CMP-KDO synthetase)